jgi:hypothetical protein
MPDPRTQAEITKIPNRNHTDFFVAIIVSSFLIFSKMKTRKAPKGYQIPLEPLYYIPVENSSHKSLDMQGQVVKLSRDDWETTI